MREADSLTAPAPGPRKTNKSVNVTYDSGSEDCKVETKDEEQAPLRDCV